MGLGAVRGFVEVWAGVISRVHCLLGAPGLLACSLDLWLTFLFLISFAPRGHSTRSCHVDELTALECVQEGDGGTTVGGPDEGGDGGGSGDAGTPEGALLFREIASRDLAAAAAAAGAGGASASAGNPAAAPCGPAPRAPSSSSGGYHGQGPAPPTHRPPQPLPSRSHWFAVVRIEVPRFKLSVKGRAYGLAGGGGGLEAAGTAKKAAVNLARTAALRRIALVLLDGTCRWAQALPLPDEIETSIVWDAPGSRPTRDELPSRCYGDDGADGAVGGGGGLEAPLLRRLDEADGARAPRDHNWHLARAMATAAPEQPTEAARFLANMAGSCS